MRQFPWRFGLGATLGALTVGGALAAAGAPAPKPKPKAAAPAAAPPAASREGIEFFEKNVRPLFASQCLGCHQSALPEPKGGLVLDSRAGVLKGGDRGPMIVPGKPEESLLIKALEYREPKIQMPPKGKLPDEKIQLIAQWIRMGAPYPADVKKPAGARSVGFDVRARAKHWSFYPIKRPAVPPVKQKTWVKNPVDSFILAKLQAKGISPAAPADRRTLIRRLTFDLIGLPPTPEEVEAFVSDKSPDAYRKVVERLLASLHYGERWGRHWLDLMRFAETDGHEFDLEKPNAYLYRDYVIKAFNADVPYNQFLLEHLAGDLLPNPRRDPQDGTNQSLIATGSFFLGEGKHSPVDLLEDQAERVDNQIDVLSKSFFGLTVSCARCHDHKFDAISTKDYYALAGILKSSRYTLSPIDNPERFRPHVQALEQLNTQLRPLLTARAARLQQQMAAGLTRDLRLALGGPGIRTVADTQEPAGGRFLAAVRQAAAKDAMDPFHPLAVLADQQDPAQFAKSRDALIQRLRAAATGREKAQLYDAFDALEFERWTATGEAFGSGPSREPRVLTEAKDPSRITGILPAGVADSGRLSGKLQGSLRSRNFKIPKGKILYRMAGRGGRVNLVIDNFYRIRDPIYGRLTFEVNSAEPRWFVQDVSLWVGHDAYIEILDHNDGFVAVDQVLFADDGTTGPNPLVLKLLEAPETNSAAALLTGYQRLVAQATEAMGGNGADPASLAVADVMLRRLPAPSEPMEASLTGLLDQHRELEAKTPTPTHVIAFSEGDPADDRVHLRGSTRTLGDTVPRRYLEVFVGNQPSPKTGSGRLELARKLLASPLASRVMVNRLWQHHFGEGIVRTVDDFGTRGDAPTHPELLDWLASEFIRQKWSIKQMHRLMVLSATYQMASRPSSAKAAQADPQNKLLHRMPIRRMEAEAIRDSVLAVSGRLDRKLFGPGVLPHLTPFMEGRGRPGASGPLDGEGRRSLYINVRRNFLTPMFLAFDFPIPFSTTGKRSVSTVPAQALTMMNNPFVVEQARIWGKRVIEEKAAGPAERVTRMYQTAFSRPPSKAELAEALQFVEAQDRQYGTKDDQRSWGDLAHVLMNVKEFIFVN